MTAVKEFYRKTRKILRNKKKIFLYYWDIYFKREVPVIIYQMGKVGSRSVGDSLKNCGISPLFHVHRINLENIKQVENEYIGRGLNPPHEKSGKFLNKNICRRNKKAKFITMVREPVSRNISAFFENHKRFTGVEYGSKDFKIEKLTEIFMTEYIHDVPLTWFDKEIKLTLGIDVYKHPFPAKKGYSTIYKGNFELLILKLEISDKIKQKAISDFFNIHDFELKKSNVSNKKIYSETYEQFKKKIALPHSYLEKMLNSKYSRHFYTNSEIDAIWSKWSDNNKPRSNV